MTDKPVKPWYVLDSNGKVISATYEIDLSNPDKNFIEYLYGQLKTLPYSGGSDRLYEALEEILEEIKEYLKTTDE